MNEMSHCFSQKEQEESVKITKDIMRLLLSSKPKPDIAICSLFNAIGQAINLTAKHREISTVTTVFDHYQSQITKVLIQNGWKL